MGLDCRALRRDFPLLENRGIVYLDNAASTLKPSPVVEAMVSFTHDTYANVHRGVYELSLKASRLYEEAHEVVAGFIGAESWEEIVFTRNTSESIQLAAMLLYWNGYIGRGDEVVVTEADHHSNLLPWVRVAEKAGARLKLVPVNSRGIPEWRALASMISERTRVVAFGHASNVTGYINPVKSISKIAREHGAMVVVDGAQSVPHMPINVADLGVDFLAFSGHKMLGPTGIGVLYARRDLAEKLDPPLGAGGTVRRVRLKGGRVSIEWDSMPWKLESGTPPIIEAVGLMEAVRYLEKIGMENVRSHEASLTEKALTLLSGIEEVEILGPENAEERLGVVSFSIRGLNPDAAGYALSRMGIAVRTGLHCAHILHDRLGHPEGSIRASFYIYNCVEDVELLARAVEEVARKYAGKTAGPAG
ncbi:MAG: cysteine desulfurase [Desulfurococcales archaeon]|nr:cysteine desulfurase [Desulfurococcales archaeon]